MFESVVLSLANLILNFRAFGYVAILGAFVVAGIFFMLGGQLREKAKESVIWIVIGATVLYSAEQLARSFVNSFGF